MRPSLSRSPNATPRCAAGFWKSEPASALTSMNFPFARLRNTEAGSSYRRVDILAILYCTMPRATKRSFQPSLSKSKIPLDHPDMLRMACRPDAMVISANSPSPEFLKSGKVSPSMAVCQTSSQPSLFTSRKSAPMPELNAPESGEPTPARSATSSNFRPARLWKSRLGGVVVGHEHVGEPIVIVVRESASHAFPAELIDIHLAGDIREGAVAIVAVERVGESGVVLGVAVGAGVRGRAAEGILVTLPP